MSKRFLIAWIVVFVVWICGSFVVHGMLLHDDYAALTNLFRTEADSQQRFAWMILAHVIMSGAFAWIYARGVESAPWAGQGLRFGIAVALLTVVPTYLIYYVVQPMPAATVVKQIVFDSILVIVLGLVVAFIEREPAAIPRPAI
jgi:hypothetical protein